MKVWVFEDNLIWSSRLVKSIQALGHEAEICTALPTEPGAQVAIVNLGSATLPGAELAPQIQALGAKVIAHAGHKEKPLLELGRQAGVDRIATNSELTFKIEALLEEVGSV